MSSGQTGYLVAHTKIGLVALRDSKARVVSENIHAGANRYLYVVAGIDVCSHPQAGLFTTEYGTPLGNNLRRSWASVMREADGGRGDLGTWSDEPVRKLSTRSTKTGRRSKECSFGPTPERAFVPRFSVYVLRHTCATLLLLGGMELLHVSRRLRHKNISITARFYGHVTAEHTTQAPEIWDRLFASAAS